MARFAALWVALGLIACANTPTAPAAVWSGLALGEHPVRAEVLDLDRHRALVFRPAAGGGPPASVAALAHAVCCARDEASLALMRRCLPQLSAALGSEGAIETVASTLTSTSLDAARSPGRYPLVVLQGSVGGRGFDFIALAEMLASHGYVVALPALAEPPAQFAVDAALVADSQQGVADAVRALSADPGIDATRLALGGWSVGGVPATLYAISNEDTDAILSFDSGIVYDYGAALLRASGADLTAFDGGLLLLSAGVANSVPRDAGAVDAMTRARRWDAEMATLTHGQFSNQIGVLRSLIQSEADRATFRADYARAALLSLNFLNERVAR